MKSVVRALCVPSVALVVGCFLVGCEPTPDPVSVPGSQGSSSGGQNGTGGSTPAGTGGASSGTGGATPAGTGGSTSGVGTGGMASSGGMVGTGGMATSTGGRVGTGGTPGVGTGGTPPAGGSTGKGGQAPGTGGTTGGGGKPAGNGGAVGGGGSSGGGFAPVAMILGTSCGTGTCHMGGAHSDLRNTTGLYARVVGAKSLGAMCNTKTLVVPNDTANSAISQVINAAFTGCTTARMPNMCSATSANPRACLTTAQIATIDSWIMAGAPM